MLRFKSVPNKYDVLHNLGFRHNSLMRGYSYAGAFGDEIYIVDETNEVFLKITQRSTVVVSKLFEMINQGLIEEVKK